MDLSAITSSLDRLDNGLPVVSVELPHLHNSLLSVYVRVGSRFEAPEDNGLSHFLEHMLFRGTSRLPSAYLLNHAVEQLGGTLYAETRRDASLYQIALHPEVAREGLGLLGEILSDPVLTSEEVERKIILEEMQEDLDHKGHDINLSDLVYAHVWPGHPLGQKITGPMANVERFGVEDLRRHFRSHYGAGNMLLCVAGPVRRQEVLGWAQAAFERLPRGPRHELLPAGEPPTAGRPEHVHRDGDAGTQTSVSLAFRACGETDPDYPALAMLLRVLDDGLSTRLYQRVVNDLGLAYYCSAGLDAFADTGLFDIEAQVVHRSVPQLLEELFALLRRLREEPVLKEELAKAKRRYRWDLLGACDDLGAMTDFWGRTRLYYQPPALTDRLRGMEAVTAEDLLRVAGRLFQPRNLVLGTVGRMGFKVRGEVRPILDGFV